MTSNLARLCRAALALALAAALWVPLLGRLAREDPAPVLVSTGLSPLAGALLSRQLAALSDDALGARDQAGLRRANPEWTLMHHSFLAWSLANAALRVPERKTELLAALDGVIDATLADESARGFRGFLLPYASAAPYRGVPERSLFVDGEVALMLEMRRLAEEKPAYRALTAERVARIATALQGAPLLSAESYPDECWSFDNATALAALRLADFLDGTNHRALIDGWLAQARQHLIDPGTGLLVSSYTRDGRIKDGPEGSTLWMTIHALSWVDPAFAADQYARARRALRVDVAGFALAREWPPGMGGVHDIDSGLTVPLLGASPSSSGLALVAAADQRDTPFLTGLLASLRYAGFPTRGREGLRFSAGNPMGDAVVLYALTQGPIAARTRGLP
jgi:hypothetical protein